MFTPKLNLLVSKEDCLQLYLNDLPCYNRTWNDGQLFDKRNA